MELHLPIRVWAQNAAGKRFCVAEPELTYLVGSEVYIPELGKVVINGVVHEFRVIDGDSWHVIVLSF